MGGLQIPSCSNCRHLAEGGVYTEECDTCIDLSNWQTRRGAKAGAPRKPGAGANKKPQGEAKIWFMLGIPEKDITAYGGLKKLKVDFIKWFYDKKN